MTPSHAGPMTLVTPAEVQTIVFTADEIAAAIARMAGDMDRDLPRESILLVGVLKGAMVFLADLARQLPGTRELRIDTLSVSSYGNTDRSSGEVRLLKDTAESVEGKHVVIVEDIIDNGLTLKYLQGLLAGRNPASLRTCVLLDKPYRRQAAVKLDYVGLTVPDAFVVGYGLDYQERFRHLPYLAKLHRWAFEG